MIFNKKLKKTAKKLDIGIYIVAFLFIITGIFTESIIPFTLNVGLLIILFIEYNKIEIKDIILNKEKHKELNLDIKKLKKKYQEEK